MIAGIGGASLGTELLKCLRHAGRCYRVYGCDISPYAYGHFEDGFDATFRVDVNRYVDAVLELCREKGIRYVLPGGEGPLNLLRTALPRLERDGIALVCNEPSVIDLCSDKSRTFEALTRQGIAVPATRVVHEPADLNNMPFPCIVKPATDSGGSAFVFFAAGREDAMSYVNYLARARRTALVQEYIPDDEGEFTVGVLTLPDGRLFGSIALRRLLDSKLSCLMRKPGVISTGYSQGLIDDFPGVRETAERIAAAVASRGPINVQGRLRNGNFVPFEINPRFSASIYLRAMAGFNEVDIFLEHLATGVVPPPPVVRPGYYLRTLAERFVPRERIES
jgi:carbamoyl-phosphate synthase large subunit